MNRLLKLAAAGTLAAVFVLAQGANPPAPPDPATMAQHRVDRLAQILTLTDAQKAQAVSIFTNAATAGSALQTDMRTLHDSLATAIKANATANIDTLAAQIGALEGKLAAINAKAEAAFYATLTADQQAKYGVRGHGMGGPGGRGMGGPGGAMGPNFRGGPRP